MKTGAFKDERWRQLNKVIAGSGLLSKATVTVETVTTVEGIAALRPCYERLQRVTGNTLPFALHQWHLSWCQHFLYRDPRRDDRPLFYVLRDGSTECVAIIPFIVSRRRVGPLSFEYLRLLGMEQVLTEIRAPQVESGYEYLTVRAVRDSLANDVDWDWIHWTGIGGAFDEALRIGGGLQRQPSRPYYALDLPPTWEEFRRGLKRNIRESLRHCYNSLQRDGLQFELQVITERAGVRAALDRFFELHALRAGLKNTVVHPNRFASPIEREFLRAVCERLSENGVFRLFCLRIGAETVAMLIGFVVKDNLYLYYSGYDPRWSRYSVMTTTMAEAIKHAIAHGLKTVTLSPGNVVFKTRWGPRELQYTSAYEQRDRLRSRLARRAYVTAVSGGGLHLWGLGR
jgi:CelD/BcsL family acetyltransferase involved in cellulose biosynthesis